MHYAALGFRIIKAIKCFDIYMMFASERNNNPWSDIVCLLLTLYSGHGVWRLISAALILRMYVHFEFVAMKGLVINASNSKCTLAQLLYPVAAGFVRGVAGATRTGWLLCMAFDSYLMCT